MSKTRRLLLRAGMAALSCLAPAEAAQAAFPGQNGRIAYTACCDNGEIASVNPDGTGETVLVSGDIETDNAWPAWSPDGTRIAFATNRDGDYEIYMMDADGSNQTRLTTHPAGDTRPSWAPDGQRIVFRSSRDGGGLYTLNTDGSGVTRIPNSTATDNSPVWSPDGRRIAFVAGGALHTIAPDGTQRTPLGVTGRDPTWSPDAREIWATYTTFSHPDCDEPTNDLLVFDTDTGTVTTPFVLPCPFEGGYGAAAVSPDNTRVAVSAGDVVTFTRAGSFSTLPGTCCFDPDWQPLPVNTSSAYARPKSANRVRFSLVPAYEACTAPNREHGPPLAFGSCAPPVPGSAHLMVGVGDGHPAPARSSGFVRLKVITGVPGGADDTTGRLRTSLTNVMRTADLSEYTGELRGSARVRVTDTEGAVSQTVQDLPLEWTVPCLPTVSTADASVCDLATDLDALVPGATPEGTRAIWALDQVRVHDGGADEDADTEGDNSLLAVQGVFVP
jgi:WD40 repeat protein